MAIRRVSKLSDRGSIKDLVHPCEAEDGLDKNPPTAAELRFKQLYEYSQMYKDIKLQQALGIITTDYISDKNALPLSVYRIRKLVEDIKSKSALQIEKLEEQIAKHLYDGIGVSEQTIAYLSYKRIKTAAARKPPVFRRVSIE
jgi:hypothetical protein